MTDTTGKLFVLEASGAGRLFSINPDGSDQTTLVTGCAVPDGVAVDVEAGHIYWTNMGKPPVNDGSIERVDLDGGNRTTIVPSGGTYTPKQLHLDTVDRKLYWGDREGMRVMRCDLDGTHIETLVQTGQGEDGRHDETNWCVGVAVDHVGGHLYWTQKGPSDAGLGRILRAGIDLPAGDSAADIVVPIEGARDLDYTVNKPITLRGLARVPFRRAPEHGERNDEVLAQLGFSADDIAQRREQKAIPAAPEQETTK